MRYRDTILNLLKALGEGILPLVFWVSIIFGFDTPDVAVLTILSAILHEIGHLIPTLILTGETERVRAHISGFRITSSKKGYTIELIELASGPLINLSVFFLTLPCYGALGGYVGLVGAVNLVTALSNLLPIEGYDGYGILTKLIEASGRQRLLSPLYYLSFALCVCITFLALYMLLKYGQGYWIFGVFFSILITKISRLIKYDVLRV